MTESELHQIIQQGDQRVVLRDKIFREVMVNAIVHREYTSAHATEMIITDSEVVITNPNKTLFHGFINKKNFTPYPKNPNLRKFFTDFGWTEEIGSGVRNTSNYVPLYSNGALPSFEEKEIFVAKIPLRHYTFKPYTEHFASWLNLPVDPTEHLKLGLDNIGIPSHLYDATWEELLLNLIPSWVEKGTELKEFLYSSTQHLIADDINGYQVGTKKGTELLPKKIWYIITILALCATPTSFGQLLRFFQYKNQHSFKETYLFPLRKLDFIRLTKPNTPNAPDNKYVITEAGKAFLLNI